MTSNYNIRNLEKRTLLACSELSSDVPGLATHFLKHLSDIFCNQRVHNSNNYANKRTIG